jgi:hypothetical protein
VLLACEWNVLEYVVVKVFGRRFCGVAVGGVSVLVVAPFETSPVFLTSTTSLEPRKGIVTGIASHFAQTAIEKLTLRQTGIR